MRISLLIAVWFLVACGPKAKPAEDPPRKRVVTTTTTVEVLERLGFDADSAEVTDATRPLLDSVVEILGNNPEITQVEVQGHADAGEDNIAELAQARAEAVLAYLVAKGVAADRLVAKGYGADEVMPPDGYDDQAAANRTVGFLILARDDD